METAILAGVTIVLLIAWAIFLGFYYQKFEDERSLENKENYIAISVAGTFLIIAWPITLMMTIVGGIMFGIAMLTRKITRRKNGFSTRG